MNNAITSIIGGHLKKIVQLLAPVAGYSLVLCLVFLFKILRASNQWDFRPQYFSALAFAKGLNPYLTSEVNTVNTTAFPIPPDQFYPYHP